MPSTPHRPFPLFCGISFNQVTQGKLVKMKAHIHAEDTSYLLNVNADSYIEHVIDTFQMAPPAIDFDNVAVSSEEKRQMAERFNFYSGVEAGQWFTCHVVTYHLPTSADEQVLSSQPNPSALIPRPIYLHDSDLCFEVTDHSGPATDVAQEAQSVLNAIKTNLGYLADNIRTFNQALTPQVRQAFEARRSELKQRFGVIASLKVPLKKAGSIPETISVPIQTRKIPTPRPSAAPGKAYQSGWTLDDATYQEILRVIHDTGRVFERLPSTYAGKNEETLRDHLILQLEPHFTWGSTTGETFNKTGKTDLLIRYEKKNVFVAECKFWRGRKAHFETIDQILRYLTWRDSKTAIVYFIDTKEISAPLAAISDSTIEHPNCRAFKGSHDGSRFTYEFHLPGDPDCPIQTEILCFHLPKS
jgi:hypothetical protein